ncbi:MAG: RecB family exonuclease [Leptospirales bacterium]
MAELVNRFSYSPSQGSMFQTCQRQYWFSRYGSWGGWEKDASPITREIYRLKKLTNRYLWTGNRVHETIQEILSLFRTGQPFDPSEMRSRLLEQFRQEFRQSRAHPRKTLAPKNKVVLIEHEDSELHVSDEEWKKLVERALTALDGFFVSEAFRLIRELGPASILRNDDILESIPASVEGYEFPVYVTIDVALKTPTGVTILDWKTGKPDPSGGHDQQLGLYALFAQSTWKIQPEQIHFSPVYLAYTPQTLDLSSASVEVLESVRATIEKNARTILERIEDPDRGIATMDQFSVTTNPYNCRNCPFRSICMERPC